MYNYNIVGWAGIICIFCIITLITNRVIAFQKKNRKTAKAVLFAFVIGITLMLISFSLVIIKQDVPAISIPIIWIGGFTVLWVLEKI